MIAANGDRAWAWPGRGGKCLSFLFALLPLGRKNINWRILPTVEWFSWQVFNCTDILYWRQWYTPCRKPVYHIQGISLKTMHIPTLHYKLALTESHRQIPTCCPLHLMLSEWDFPESSSARVCHYHIYTQIKETFRTAISSVLRTIFTGKLFRMWSTRTWPILLSKQRLSNNILKRGLKLDKTERGIKHASLCSTERSKKK